MRLRAAVAVAAVVLSACSLRSSSPPADWSQKSSASDGGGMQELVKAAKREGRLTLAMRPNDSGGWLANLQGFERAYGIQLEMVTTDINDAAQVADARRLDVLDLSPDVADANTSLLAPYLVFYWLEIPPPLKQAKAYWYEDCGGYMAIGYDPTHVSAVTSVAGLLDGDLAHGVTLVGDPRVDEGALTAVVMASIASGGSADNVAPGVDFFRRMQAAGNLGAWGAAAAPPVVVDWEFHQPRLLPSFPSWTYVVPADAAVAAYRAQAVSRFAPHPAAARLWEEYLFSDSGQNACLNLRARPARMDAMRGEGTLDLTAEAALYPVGARLNVLTPAELAAARAYLEAHWAAAVGQ